MKKQLFKRLWTASLAAVTALAFLPAGALTAFAATSTPNAVTTGTVIDVGRDYTLANGCTAISVAANAGGIVDIDLNGQTVTVDLSAARDTRIVLRDSGKFRDTSKAGDVRYATLTVKGASAVESLTLAGNMNTGSVDPTTLMGKDGIPAVKDQPVALINGIYYVGNAAINAASEGQDIIAVSGSVNINSLTAGHSATLYQYADANTKITAATAFGTSLTTIRTAYSYYYCQVGSSSLDGAGSYTSTLYYAGEDAGKAAISRLSAPTRTGSLHLASGQGGVYSIPSYTREITVNMNGDSWKTLLLAPSTSVDRQDEDADKYYGRINGITYFTSDPSPYSSGLVACLDGTKYILGLNRLKDVAKTAAKAKIQILRGSSFSSTSGNLTSYDAFTAGNVSVTGPSDEAVVENKYVTRLGANTETLNYVQVFGTKHGPDNETFTYPTGEVASRTINVAQLAQGSTLTFEAVTGVPVTKGSGVGYYSYASTDNLGMTSYHFGSPSEITAEFTDYVAPHKENGLTIPAKIGRNVSATVFASSEIRTTLYDVDFTISIQGESSARVIGKADGKQNWEVNAEATTADTNATIATALPAYRLYDRTRGEHIYTYNSAERAALIKAGWVEEKSNFRVLPISASQGVVVYRVYNPNNGGTHMYTKNLMEMVFLKQNGWKEGKPVFRTAEATTGNGKPVYRLKNPNSKNGEHQFTTEVAERNMLTRAGWTDEGIAFYSFR